jgi:hypothetical protein
MLRFESNMRQQFHLPREEAAHRKSSSTQILQIQKRQGRKTKREETGIEIQATTRKTSKPLQAWISVIFQYDLGLMSWL